MLIPEIIVYVSFACLYLKGNEASEWRMGRNLHYVSGNCRFLLGELDGPLPVTKVAEKLLEILSGFSASVGC